MDTNIVKSPVAEFSPIPIPSSFPTHKTTTSQSSSHNGSPPQNKPEHEHENENEFHDDYHTYVYICACTISRTSAKYYDFKLQQCEKYKSVYYDFGATATHPRAVIDVSISKATTTAIAATSTSTTTTAATTATAATTTIGTVGIIQLQ